MNLPHVAQRLFNAPLALHPQKAEVVISALSDRFGITKIYSSNDWAWADDDEFSKQSKDVGYDILENVAIIPIQGTLVQKLGQLRPYSGMTGYDGIRQSFLVALNDPDVKAICLDIDSPGGEVAGCFDLADLIYQSRGKKPIHAILSENAYSAAYALASCADKITVPRTGGVGSIGVIVIHCDWSQHIKDDGLKVTIITCGDRKAESNPMKPLTDRAKAALQESVDITGDLFFETVARNRGIKKQSIIDMQAACFLSDEGLKLGLVDEVKAPDAAFLNLVEKIRSRNG